MAKQSISRAFRLASKRCAALGGDGDAALRRFATNPASLPCWQGDDVGGFENASSALGGGLAVTGNYPGRHRVHLHALHGEFGGEPFKRENIDQLDI